MKRAELRPALLRLWWAALGAALVGLLIAGRYAVLPTLAFVASAWMILGALAELVHRIRLFQGPLHDSLVRLRGLPRAAFGTALAHAGMGVTVAGIAGMSLATQAVLLVHPGETVHVAGYDWRLVGLADEMGPNYIARVATIDVSRNGHPVVTLRPSRRAFPVEQTTTTDTAIRTNFLWDLYAVLGEERDGAAVLRLNFNPMAPWIWLGALVMAAGGGLSLSDRRLRVGAPSRRAVPHGVAAE